MRRLNPLPAATGSRTVQDRGPANAPDWELVRAEFPVLDQHVYLNAGVYGPLPRCAADAAGRQLQIELHRGRASDGYYEVIDALRDRTVQALSSLLGVPASTLALTSSTTSGCQVVISGLGLKSGDEIVTTSQEHHAILTVLRTSPATLVTVDISEADDDELLQRIADAVTPRTRLIALSHVMWRDGRVLPVDSLSSLGPPVMVDGAQSVGAIPVDVKQMGCQFFIFPGQKWLLGAEAIGGLYVHPDWHGRLRVAQPCSYGHQPWAGQDRDLPLPGAARFTPGPIAMPALAAFHAALMFAATLGRARFHRARRTAQGWFDALSADFEMARPPKGNIFSFDPGRDAAEACASLEGTGVLVRTIPTTNWLRCCVGFWNDASDLRRLTEGLRL